MEDFELISPANIMDIALKVRDGEAEPKDVRRLLETICHMIETNQPLSDSVLQYIKDSFQDHLNNPKSLDRAFGVSSKQGRRRVDEYFQLEIAIEVLRQRLNGRNHEYATVKVGHEFDRRPTAVNTAWSAQKRSAFSVLGMDLISKKSWWTNRELLLLDEIFYDEKLHPDHPDTWYSTPVKDRN